MTSQQFAVGALISLSIAIFTVVSTIYSAIVTTDKTNNNININREIIKLRDNLSLSYDFPFDNFNDYQSILDQYKIKSLLYYKSNIKNNNMQIFMAILAYREGKILEDKDHRGNFLQKNSMQYFLKQYSNDDNIEHNDILWYPLRQLS